MVPPGGVNLKIRRIEATLNFILYLEPNFFLDIFNILGVEGVFGPPKKRP